MDLEVTDKTPKFRVNPRRGVSSPCRYLNCCDPLLVYEISTCTAQSVERRISEYTRKWLDLPARLTDVALHRESSRLRLPLKSVVVEFAAVKARIAMMLTGSTDMAVGKDQATLKAGRRWRLHEEVVNSEEGT